MYTIAFIDDDEQTRAILYQKYKDAFNIHNFQLNMNSSIESIIEEFEENSIDCLIIDYLLDESGDLSFTGDRLVDEIHIKRPYFPLIVLTSYEDDALDNISEVNIVNDKDKYMNKGVETFKKKITNLIEQYKNNISNKEKRLSELLQINLKEITINEEEEIDSIYSFLEKIYPDEKSFPTHLQKRETVSKISDLLNKTQEILKILEKE